MPESTLHSAIVNALNDFAKEHHEESAHVSPPLEKVKQWLADHPESIQAYDDQATRQLVERVTVLSTDTVRIKFYGIEDERVSIGDC